MRLIAPLTALLALLATPAMAQEAAPAASPPKLLVVISVDQLSADLLAEYRGHFTGGFKRLLSGAVFPSGYQSHASTETCPGHATILSGARPSRNGVVANEWYDLSAARANKSIYCAENLDVDEKSAPGLRAWDGNLEVPTLGEWLKAASPASRIVSIAGKDRSAIMMGGHKVDELWWADGATFISYAGRATPRSVTDTNAAIAERLGTGQPARAMEPFCENRDRAFEVGGGTIGTHRFDRAAGDTRAFRNSPELDEAILSLAARMAIEMKLGQGTATDVIAVGAAATDYVGHRYGSGGVEMCLHLFALDRSLGQFFEALDATGVDYVVALTADHGGLDAPERLNAQGIPDAARVDPKLNAVEIGKAVAARLVIEGQLLWGGSFGDVYVDPKLSREQQSAVLTEAARLYAAHPQVAAILTAADIAATPSPSGPPETWSLLQRARASYFPGRSGQLYVVLKPRIMPIARPAPGGTVATHGSAWDYDRRLPILFWRKGMMGFEQPLSVETVDIAPTLAALIGLKIPVEIDGRCLDLDAGPGDTCN